ncbi:uncharacterized protein DS421_14g460290 [Arachis hypogaea]|nr:uncharacterized protein DS421_14g460290 [Arachis hypogaea]
MNDDRQVLPILEHSPSVIITNPYGAAVTDLPAPHWASSSACLNEIMSTSVANPNRSYSNASSESTMMGTTPVGFWGL